MALVISILSLIISVVTFWLTRIRKGSLKMTRPSIICFLGRSRNDEPKIFIRTLLYGTSDQGQYVQNMFIRIRVNESIQNFNVWAYGDSGLVRGSGLFVSKSGNSIYHHFLLPKNEQWDFIAGNYILEVFVETVDNKTKKIFEQNLSLTIEQSESIKIGNAIFYNWASNTQKYISHSETIRNNDFSSKRII